MWTPTTRSTSTSAASTAGASSAAIAPPGDCPTGVPCFHPYDNITRGQVAKIGRQRGGLHRRRSPRASTFTDVPPSHPFYALHPAAGGPRPASAATTHAGHLPHRHPLLPARRTTSRAASSPRSTPTPPGYTDTPALGQQTLRRCAAQRPVLALHRAAGAARHHQRLRLRQRATSTPAPACWRRATASSRPYFRACANITRGQTAKIVANTFFPVNCAPGIPAPPQ